MATKMTYDENYGEVSVGQLRSYKRFNVSPSDHDELVFQFGENPDRIRRYVDRNAAANGGMYSAFDLMMGRFI